MGSINMNIAIVIDNQTSYSRVGFAGDDKPRAVFPTLYGEAKRRFPPLPNEKEIYFPDEALQNEKDCIIRRSIEHGLIDNWVAMEVIWDWIFSKQLRADPKLHPVLLTEAPNNLMPIREKMAEIMFETFEVPALCVKSQAFLSAYASENITDPTLNIKEYASWLGGSLLATDEWIQQNSVTLEEYWEEGPITIHRCV